MAKPYFVLKFCDLITDHKVLSDNCESRNNHRYAVVVQDLATQWIQACPCKTKTSQTTQRSLQKILEPDRKPQVILNDNLRVTTQTKICAISVLQCALKQWRNDLNKIQEKNEFTAKSRPMMSLIERVPSNISSSTSEIPGKRSYGNQNPWSTIAEKEEGSGQPVVSSDPKTASDCYHEQFIESSFSARYSKVG